MKKIKPIAFYLPQYHPIPENDVWWGKGFTEWTNVAKARPLFTGHWQPRLPADFGFYDLRVSEVRQAQAQLAAQYGIHGFCYWHYWFGNGKRLLERPFNEVLESGTPDFPFCLAWANETWTGIWHGAPNKVLIEQTYPGIEDYKDHFYSVLQAFKDERYIKVDGKPVFLIYRPYNFNFSVFLELWHELALNEGLPGIHFIAVSEDSNLLQNGFSGLVFNAPSITMNSILNRKIKNKTFLQRLFNNEQESLLKVVDYTDYVNEIVKQKSDFPHYPLLLPGWDNTPRANNRGYVLLNSTPEVFRKLCSHCVQKSSQLESSEQFVFIKSWNEWAEGNYMEPDSKFGHDYLKVFKEELDKSVL